MTKTDGSVDELAKILLKFKGKGELLSFLQDLCTPSELSSLAERWRVARLLETGLSYREINLATGVSTATVTRVARSLSLGTGYRQALEVTTKLD